MANIGTIAIKLVAQSTEFTAGLNKAASKVKSFASGLEGSTGRLGGIFSALTSKWTALLGAFGVSVSVGALVGLTKQAFGAIDAMDELSSKTGISVEKLQALQYAAKFSGVSAEQLTTAIGKMQKNIASGSDIFERTGMDVGNLLGMDADQQIGAIADRLQSIQNPAERTAFAMEVFGKAGAHLLPFLEGGSQGLAELEQELQKTGVAFSSVDATQVAIAADGIDRAKTTAMGFFNQIAIQLSPAILDITNRFNEWALSGEGVGVKVRNAIGWVIDSIGWLMDSVMDATRVFLSFGAGINDILAKVSGSFGYLWDSLKVGGKMAFVMVLDAFNEFAQMIGDGINKIIEGLNSVSSVAGFEPIELFKTDNTDMDKYLSDMKAQIEVDWDARGSQGEFEKQFQDNSKLLNNQIKGIEESQKPSSKLKQWWAEIDDKMGNEVAAHEDVKQLEDDGLDIEKEKTKEKEKQKRVEEGGFLISKAGRIAAGGDMTFGGMTDKAISQTTGGVNNKDQQIVSELQEQTGYLRTLAAKPNVPVFG